MFHNIVKVFGLAVSQIVLCSGIVAAGELERETHELIGRLKATTDTEERSDVFRRLAEIGPEAREAVPWLIEHFNDAERTFEFDEQRALVHIGPEAVPALALELRHARDVNRRQTLIELLKDIGPDARAAA